MNKMMETMTKEEMEQKITELQDEIVKLRGIIMQGRYPTHQRITDRLYIKSIDDISLTAIGDTSAGDESSNITANFNKIISALTNQ